MENSRPRKRQRVVDISTPNSNNFTFEEEPNTASTNSNFEGTLIEDLEGDFLYRYQIDIEEASKTFKEQKKDLLESIQTIGKIIEKRISFFRDFLTSLSEVYNSSYQIDGWNDVDKTESECILLLLSEKKNSLANLFASIKENFFPQKEKYVVQNALQRAACNSMSSIFEQKNDFLELFTDILSGMDEIIKNEKEKFLIDGILSYQQELSIIENIKSTIDEGWILPSSITKLRRIPLVREIGEENKEDVLLRIEFLMNLNSSDQEKIRDEIYNSIESKKASDEDWLDSCFSLASPPLPSLYRYHKENGWRYPQWSKIPSELLIPVRKLNYCGSKIRLSSIENLRKVSIDSIQSLLKETREDEITFKILNKIGNSMSQEYEKIFVFPIIRDLITVTLKDYQVVARSIESLTWLQLNKIYDEGKNWLDVLDGSYWMPWDTRDAKKRINPETFNEKFYDQIFFQELNYLGTGGS